MVPGVWGCESGRRPGFDAAGCAADSGRAGRTRDPEGSASQTQGRNSGGNFASIAFPDGSFLLLQDSGIDVARRLHVITNVEALLRAVAPPAPKRWDEPRARLPSTGVLRSSIAHSRTGVFRHSGENRLKRFPGDHESAFRFVARHLFMFPGIAELPRVLGQRHGPIDQRSK